MKKLFQKLAIWFYEKMDCRNMDTNSFWTYHLLYAVPSLSNSKIIIAEINRITGQIEHVGDWSVTGGFKDGQGF